MDVTTFATPFTAPEIPVETEVVDVPVEKPTK
jgi:hypothetical protein